MTDKGAVVLTAIAIFDIDGVVRDVAGSYRRAIADTVERFTEGQYRPTLNDIDALKTEGCWNNDWKASEELIYRFYRGQGQSRDAIALDYERLVDFFQSRYRGENFTGYIQDEPLLLTLDYLKGLTQAQISWGFFSGATRGSALYVLEQRLGLDAPVLVAMGEAPEKPDPTGLMATVEQLWAAAAMRSPCVDVPIFYVGDTVADMQTVVNACDRYPQYTWLGVGVLPPHARTQQTYADRLQDAGATIVFDSVQALTPAAIHTLLVQQN